MSTPTKDGLLAAMLAVQAEAPTLPKDKVNPHFKSKFTPLDTIVETIKPLLCKHGLVWSTLPCADEHGRPALRYRLAHVATGEALEDVMPLLLVKADPQGQGSAITYARRYTLCAVLNLVADDDDDGSAGSRSAANGTATAPPENPPLTGAGRDKIAKAIHEAGVAEGMLLAAAGFTSIDDVKTVADAVKVRAELDKVAVKA